MSNRAKREYLGIIRERYRRARKQGKQQILGEFCQVCGYHRKYAIRLLNTAAGVRRSERRAGRPPCYTHPDIVRFLKRLWKATNLPCGKRLKAMIPLWLPFDQSIAPEAREHLQTENQSTFAAMTLPNQGQLLRGLQLKERQSPTNE